jgi:mannose-6-phosphate isomerase-like protein (cupin superfamily)
MASSERVLIINLSDSPDYQKLLDGEPQTQGMRAGRVYLRPGKACGQHSTGSNEEVLVFLAGRGELLIGEKDSFPVGKGKISYIPPNTVHDVKNTGNEPLVYIYCVAPVGGEVRK